ncbi:hypothetical protein NTE_02383 [Candidatus Nitrososphaera evergladensis SR1]|jgi:hypothetical protein|uniref:Uncharacterized protein n=1 Tax=Candidatus Nitrososphaera evergladensis SR1 TaxID=1459636 RepID=A0A075MT99_9ARCH|nr:hypothetical protein [Candidatus Nitrososphaera evergladensis]AIF84435.1 hypothetical protein NTE_02383 [Candidatus Nitrososphaera evergladensis SR1]
MKTLAEVKHRGGDNNSFQFIASKLDNWDITAHVDTSGMNLKEVEKRLVSGEQVFVVVEIKDEIVEKAFVRLGGVARQQYVLAVYGIPESFRFP